MRSLLAVLIFGAISAFSIPIEEEHPGCWKQAYGRGVGKPISTCRPGDEQNGALCYPRCRDGFHGVGPVCWQNCPSGFRDDGAFCFKPPSYGRGAGYPVWDEDLCNRENQDVGGCEMWGAIWYPKCRPNFHNVACCVCSPNCPSGMPDIGVSCQKQSYGRGAGTPLICQPHEEMSGALCYPPCRQNFNGIGPVCWGKCPPNTKECGALCLETGGSCTDKVLETMTSVINVVIGLIIKDPNMSLEAALQTATGLMYQMCSQRKTYF